MMLSESMRYVYHRSTWSSPVALASTVETIQDVMRDQISLSQPDWACFHFYNDTDCGGDRDLDWTGNCINQEISASRDLPAAIDSLDRDWGKSLNR